MTPVLAIMGSIGWPEMLLILVLVLLFFGPRRLPEIAEAMGKNSANTARMIVARALARLAETMEEPRGGRSL